MTCFASIRKTAVCVMAATLTFVICTSASAQPTTAPAADEELVDNPEYKSWAEKNPETTVSHKMNTAAGGMQMTGETTRKLLEVTDEELVVEERAKMNMMGQTHESPPQTRKIKAKVPKSEAERVGMPPEMKGEVKEAGEEKVKIGEDEYKCKVLEFTGDHEGTKSKGKLWVNEEVPGMLVKMEAAIEGEVPTTINMELTGIEEK